MLKTASSAVSRYAMALIAFTALALFAANSVRIESDFTAFLPPSTTPEERLLIAQLRDGLVSRLMLVALQGDRKSTRLNSSHPVSSRMPSSA